MSITKAQLKKRSKHLGGSDIPAIMGFDPFKSPADVFYEKSGLLDGRDVPTKVMDDGSLMELSTLAFAARTLGKLDTKAPERIGLDGLLVDHPDAIALKQNNVPVEAKSQQYKNNELWGEKDSDQVPERVVIQAHSHMLCCESDICYVPVYLVFRGFVMFKVQRSDAIIDAIKQSAMEFWQNNVQKKICPADCKPSIEILKRLKHIPNKIIDIPESVAAGWIEARKHRIESEAQEELAEASLLATLGDAEAGNFKGGKITNFEQKRKAYTVKETTYRVLRIKEQ